MDNKKSTGELVKMAFRAVALATATAALVLNALGVVDANTQMTLLAIGVTCLAIASL